HVRRRSALGIGSRSSTGSQGSSPAGTSSGASASQGSATEPSSLSSCAAPIETPTSTSATSTSTLARTWSWESSGPQREVALSPRSPGEQAGVDESFDGIDHGCAVAARFVSFVTEEDHGASLGGAGY